MTINTAVTLALLATLVIIVLGAILSAPNPFRSKPHSLRYFKRFQNKFLFVRRILIPSYNEPDTAPVQIGLYRHGEIPSMQALAVLSPDGKLLDDHRRLIVIVGECETHPEADLGATLESMCRKVGGASTRNALEFALLHLSNQAFAIKDRNATSLSLHP